MISFEAARKIGINACIDRLGRDFVFSHRDRATSAYGENGGYVYCFVGVDTNCKSMNRNGILILDAQSRFSRRASCNVDLETGTIDFIS